MLLAQPLEHRIALTHSIYGRTHFLSTFKLLVEAGLVGCVVFGGKRL